MITQNTKALASLAATRASVEGGKAPKQQGLGMNDTTLPSDKTCLKSTLATVDNATHTVASSQCARCCLVMTTAKQAITDLLGELCNLDVRTATKLSRRVERVCPWLKGA